MLNVDLNRSPVTRPGRVATTLAVLLVAVLIAGFGAAQTFSTFSGSVVDTTNRFVPGVTLMLENVQSQAKYEVTSDSEGRFAFVGLPPGNYSWETRAMGFAPLKGAIVVRDRDIQQDLAIRVGVLQETLTIKGGGSSNALPSRDGREADRITQQQAVNPCSTGAVGGAITPPTKLRHVNPQYPPDLNAGNIGGVVILEAMIDANGNVADLAVLRSPNPGLDLAATEAVHQWRFTPTFLNCVPVEVRMMVTAHFVSEP